MAVVNTKSAGISDLDNPQIKLTPAFKKDGRLREAADLVSAVSGDSIGSTYRFVRLWSGWRVTSILLSTTAITTSQADVGLYDEAAKGGAVVDADFFASAQSLAAALADSDVTRESGVVTVANIAKRLWEQLGLAEDPRKWFDVVVTLTAAAGSAGDIVIKARYVDGT